MTPVPDPPLEIVDAIRAAPSNAQEGLWALRTLILQTAQDFPEIGEVRECLKWGQPSFTTPSTKAGSTLRIGCPKSGGFAIYAHCQTTIIAQFADLFPGQDKIEGNRAVHFASVDEITPERHRHLIAHALRYHLLK